VERPRYRCEVLPLNETGVDVTNGAVNREAGFGKAPSGRTFGVFFWPAAASRAKKHATAGLSRNKRKCQYFVMCI
jgi:hypothetical protein